MLSKLVLAFALVAFLATASAYKVDVGTATVANTPFQHAGSAVSWYNYNVVHGSSSSTPHSVEVKDTMVVSVVKAGDNKHYVAVINDIPNDQNGGSATLQITCGKGPSGTDTDLFNDCRQALVNVVQHDDPTEYLSETSTGSGIFTVSWSWASCCTDGIMVGPFNDENVDMKFQLTDHDSGIKGLRIASQVNGQTEHTSTFGSTEVVHIYGALEGGEPPVVNCQPPSPAISWGDPHFTTFDGRRYNYQGRGAHMFCLAGGVEIQVCHEPWRNNNRASVNRAVAFNAGDETVVLFYDTTHNIHINGVDAGLACGSTHTFVDGSVFSRSSSCNSLTYTSNTGYRLAITMRAQHFDIQFHAPSSGLTGSLGLCGYGDCDSSNDFTNPAGDVVTGINEFGTSWQLGNALRDSLFGSSFTCGEPDVPEPPIEGPICGTEPHPVCDCCAEIEDPVLKEDCAFDALVAFQALTADGVDETAALDQVCEELEIPTCDPECRGGCEDGVCVCATGSAPECLAPNEGFDCGCKKASASSETNKVYLTFVEGGVCPANNP